MDRGREKGEVSRGEGRGGARGRGGEKRGRVSTLLVDVGGHELGVDAPLLHEALAPL